jgi:hypothetical protein
MKKNISKRSLAKVSKKDLVKLAKIADIDRNEFFNKYPVWRKLYRNRILCVTLCQGAALHYVDKKNGVKDFDVWTFYRGHSKTPFPYRRIGRMDYGPSKFGVHPMDKQKYNGRKVDLIGRSIKCDNKDTFYKIIHNYLEKGKTKSARLLSKKAVIILEPLEYLGEIIWPIT